MKKNRLQSLAVLAATVLLSVLGIWAQGTGKTASTPKAKHKQTPADKSTMKTMSHKEHPFPNTTEVHLLPDGCRAQEPLVHANGKDETPPGTVTFYSDSEVVLHMNPPGILKGDDETNSTITVKAHAPTKVDVLVDSTLPTYTHFTIGDCPATNAKKLRLTDASDPNDVIVP